MTEEERTLRNLARTRKLERTLCEKFALKKMVFALCGVVASLLGYFTTYGAEPATASSQLLHHHQAGGGGGGGGTSQRHPVLKEDTTIML